MEYVVIKHPLPGKCNYSVSGIRFINNIAVVVKGSKDYLSLKKDWLLKRYWKEFPIETLKVLGFRSNDIRRVWGPTVLDIFLKAYNKEDTPTSCQYTKKDGTACTHGVNDKSPSHFCIYHLRFDKDYKKAV